MKEEDYFHVLATDDFCDMAGKNNRCSGYLFHIFK
jgi:hypothetical protein